jgi:hypothetical protein
VLAQYHIVDDPKRASPAHEADEDPDEPMSLHETVEPYEDEPTRGTCADSGADFDLTVAETERRAHEMTTTSARSPASVLRV